MSFEKLAAENIEKKKPSLLEGFDAAVEVVAKIEGGYTRREMNPGEIAIVRREMMAAKEALERDLEKAETPEERERLLGRVMTGFQGLSGFNRYEVRGDGTLVLSRMHTVAACRKIAAELGVDITEF